MSNVCSEIRTAIRPREAGHLYALARGRRVLECGTNLGYSAIMMAEGASSVWTVDRHQDWTTDTLASVRLSTKSYGVRSKMVLIVGEFGDVLPQLPMEHFGFGFLDGFDGAAEVAAHIGLMEGHLTRQAYLAVHDYDSVAVRCGIDLPTVRRNWRLAELVDTLAVLERV